MSSGKMRNHKYGGRKSSMNFLSAFCILKSKCPHLNENSCSALHDGLQHVAQSHAHLIFLVCCRVDLFKIGVRNVLFKTTFQEWVWRWRMQSVHGVWEFGHD